MIYKKDAINVAMIKIEKEVLKTTKLFNLLMDLDYFWAESGFKEMLGMEPRDKILENAKRIMQEDKYIVKEEFKTLCCIFSRKKGDILSIFKQTSKNRLMIVGEQGDVHKVKRSTFFRCCELYEA